MPATVVTSPRSFRYYLAGRQRNFANFQIRPEVVSGCNIVANTKRRVEIRLSTGRRLGGFCTISSGTELYIPTRFRNSLRNADSFHCEVIGHETSRQPTLAWLEDG